MRVDELRAILSKYEADKLREIVVMLYRKIPKARKEEDDLDNVLLDFSLEKPKSAKAASIVDFPTLKTEIECFLFYADQQYYFAPNKYVSKANRPKWRFMVKRFIKSLLSVRGENGIVAAQLLVSIYDMLSYACHYYIFRTENPFSSVGYAQTELLGIVLSKIFLDGYDKETIRMALFLTLDSNVDRENLPQSLFYTLQASLKTPDVINLALTQVDTYRKEYDAIQKAKRLFTVGGNAYRAKEHKGQAAQLYLILKFRLFEYDEGIAYYWKYNTESEDEIALYCLLEYYLDDDEFENLWIREFERAVAKGIKPREDLRTEYLSKSGKSKEL
ncbi:hypothetical protein FACS1894111_01200 [Clostridia bacterium]|nr:hypothetical protein FACS1894111_01200 [Clostridia bacterium]